MLAFTPTATNVDEFVAAHAGSPVELEGVVIHRMNDEHIGDHITVAPLWKGVDRPYVGGTAISPNKIALARRLAKAMVDGAAFASIEVRTDNFGETYVSASNKTLARRLNADLRRLGY